MLNKDLLICWPQNACSYVAGLLPGILCCGHCKTRDPEFRGLLHPTAAPDAQSGQAIASASRPGLCWGWGMALIGGRAAIWLWSWKAQGLNPAMSISVWPRRGYLKPFKTIFFSAIKWRLYYLLLGFLSWVTCLAYNKQLINGRYNLIIAKIVITLCTLLPWIRIDKRNQYMQHGYHSLWQLFRNLPKC